VVARLATRTERTHDTMSLSARADALVNWPKPLTDTMLIQLYELVAASCVRLATLSQPTHIHSGLYDFSVIDHREVAKSAHATCYSGHG
jgi:hypothetical protein